MTPVLAHHRKTDRPIPALICIIRRFLPFPWKPAMNGATSSRRSQPILLLDSLIYIRLFSYLSTKKAPRRLHHSCSSLRSNLCELHQSLTICHVLSKRIGIVATDRVMIQKVEYFSEVFSSVYLYLGDSGRCWLNEKVESARNGDDRWERFEVPQVRLAG